MNHLRSVAIAAAALAALPALAQQQYPATLAGHSILPAATYVPAPADAPAALQTSGKFTAPDRKRVTAIGSIRGVDSASDPKAPRTTGIDLPFTGQPVQGFSGIKKVGDGTFWVLTDNGFGSKVNSPDAALMFHQVRPDWTGGKTSLLKTNFLHDPDKVIPFAIVNEGTAARYLTGSDFDIESIQPVGDAVYFGDEFGPYLIRADRTGKITGFWETKLDGAVLRSPDNYMISTPPAPGPVAFQVRRSKGFEGMAASPDGSKLYPLLEGPVWDAKTNNWEMKEGRQYLRILEFDVQKGDWTGKSWKYPLEANGNAIGDFNMIDATSGLIIERDDGEGDAAKACAGEAKPDCFNMPAKFKRVYKIDMAQADGEGFVKKVGYIDLMAINDPDKKARVPLTDGKLTFPFFTIENVEVIDAEHILVGNDNNLPFSSGRAIGRADDNEFVLLKAAELLKAK